MQIMLLGGLTQCVNLTRVLGYRYLDEHGAFNKRKQSVAARKQSNHCATPCHARNYTFSPLESYIYLAYIECYIKMFGCTSEVRF